MIYLWLLGGLFLGWSFGRNNLSNVFGTAVGTRMISFKVASVLAGVSILLGAVFSSSNTTESIVSLGQVDSAFGAFLISVAIGLTILLAGRLGIPVSIVQGSIGAIVGWNLFWGIQNNWQQINEIVMAWFYAPVLSAIASGLFFLEVRRLLKYLKIPLLYRDLWVRILLIVSGIYSAYFLGANNMPAIVGPYLTVDGVYPSFAIIAVGFSIVIGALMADRRVIETVSTGLFPLSPLEGLIVVLSCGIVLYCFSGHGLEKILIALSLPSFPLVPIPVSSVLIGSILGVGLAKGRASIQWGVFSKMLVSWILVPIVSGLICWIILTILTKGGSAL